MTDAELIVKYKLDKEKYVVGELFKRHTDFAFAVSMKYLKNEEDSKDAVMQVFELLFQYLIKHEIANFKSWLYSVVKNHCLHLINKSKQLPVSDVDTEYFSGNHMENKPFMYQEGDFVLEEKLQLLENAVHQLSEEQKICIELFYLQDKSYQEIMETTGLSFKNVKSFIQNGKRNLKIIMTQNHG
jgi:RNA polymerase sigma factor (sigma-70 family)